MIVLLGEQKGLDLREMKGQRQLGQRTGTHIVGFVLGVVHARSQFKSLLTRYLVHQI